MTVTTTMTTTEFPLPTVSVRPAGHLARIPAVLRSEWIKATTVRTNKIILVLAAVIGLLSSWATALFVTDETLFVANVFVFPTTLTGVLAALAGVLLFSAEVFWAYVLAALAIGAVLVHRRDVE